ncbi:MAG: antibiotic biosynthesis monooxygenase [Burkholderiales bacterium]|nr:antibiotic biosynthesis monooxygenase [Burkholderiales bacterium]
MFVVIFRATARHLDAEYSATAATLRNLALTQFGCLEFVAVTEGDQEVALSYWPDEASIRAWKQHTDHLMAQRLGRERWYRSYSVEVAEIKRHYQQPNQRHDASPAVS